MEQTNQNQNNNVQISEFKRVYQNNNGNKFEAQYDSTNPDNCYKIIQNKGEQPQLISGVPKELHIQGHQHPQLESGSNQNLNQNQNMNQEQHINRDQNINREQKINREQNIHRDQNINREQEIDRDQNINKDLNDNVQYSEKTFKRVYQNNNGNEFEAQYDSTNPDNCYKVIKNAGEQPKIIHGIPKELNIEGQQQRQLESGQQKQHFNQNEIRN